MKRFLAKTKFFQRILLIQLKKNIAVCEIINGKQMRLLIKSCYRAECQTSLAHHDDTLQMKFLWRLGFYGLTLTIFLQIVIQYMPRAKV